jgi:hypothetical protein
MVAFLQYRPTGTIYQYTSVEGFFGILKSKRLWLSDLASANDPRELVLGREKVIEALTWLLEHQYEGEKAARLRRFIEITHAYFSTTQTFSCCFSMAADELPMWGAYGARYGGIALGFRPAAILGIPARVQKVRYIDPASDDSFRTLAHEIAAQLDRMASTKDWNTWISAVAGADAMAAVTAVKHVTWAYEREIRLVHVRRAEQSTSSLALVPIAEFPKGQPLRWTPPLTRSVECETVYYLEFPFGRVRDGKFDPTRSLKRVIIGPNCPLTANDVASVLDDNGFVDYEVVQSHCQIR